MVTDCALFIPSCDKFSDLWDPFFFQFSRNWPECPYKIYVGSNKKKYRGKGKIHTILTGEDKGWAVSFKAILRQIQETYLFIWPEDAFITSAVAGNLFDRYFRLMKKLQIRHIHYRCKPEPEGYVEDNELGVYPKGMPYRVNMAGFWNRSYLMNLLIEGETVWNFEIMGSYRTSYDDGFYCLREPLFSFIHLSEKYRWNTQSVAYCLQHDIPLDVSARKFQSHDSIKTLQDIYFNFALNIDWRIRVKMMHVLRKLLISY